MEHYQLLGIHFIAIILYIILILTLYFFRRQYQSDLLQKIKSIGTSLNCNNLILDLKKKTFTHVERAHKVAVVTTSGESITFQQLDHASSQLAATIALQLSVRSNYALINFVLY